MDFFENLTYFLSNYMRGALWLYLPLVFTVLGLWLGYHLWARFIEQLELGTSAANRLRRNNTNLSRRIRDFQAENTEEKVTQIKEPAKRKIGKKASAEQPIDLEEMDEEVKTITLQAPQKLSQRKPKPVESPPTNSPVSRKAGEVAEEFFEDPDPMSETDDRGIESLSELFAQEGSQDAVQNLLPDETEAADGVFPWDVADQDDPAAKRQAQAETPASTSGEETEPPKELALQDKYSDESHVSLSDLEELAQGIDHSQFGAEPEKPELDSYAVSKARYPGETTIVKHDLGVIFAGQPSWKDNLTEINGISEEVEGRLNGLGIFRFYQVADWNLYNVWAFNKRLAFSSRIEREGWVEQAARLARSQQRPGDKIAAKMAQKMARISDASSPELGSEKSPATSASPTERDLNKNPEQLVETLFKGEDVEADPTYGVLYRTAPDSVDDLKEIWGVGSLLEQKLNEAGIYRFLQVATWSDPAIDAFQERLHFPERIRRDDWVRQARELISES